MQTFSPAATAALPRPTVPLRALCRWRARMAAWVGALLLAAGGCASDGVTRAAPVPADAEPWVGVDSREGDFVLADGSAVASIVVSDDDAKVVNLAAGHLAQDIERVTGRRPTVGSAVAPTAVIIGTLGQSALIEQLVRRGRLDVTALRGSWESFVITTLTQPLPGVEHALVIVGSDRRGTAFGAFELSQAIGVSPWYWWSDVVPERRPALYVRGGVRRFGPPSVKYRGIFINDEDWGLHRWAAKTFEPEYGGIGPRTYEKVFELMLRLKANSLWPAMHPPTRAFNDDPRNAALADDYAIVMGSSHAEPMLRNNGKEWKAPAEAFDYSRNPDGVLQYWRERIATHGRYENLYSIGMRGINDSAMKGPKDDAARRALLERVFADQRALLPAGAAQIFTPYKEVLPLYNQGLSVPGDVTLVWPDDNFGYIRRYASAAEAARPGGTGVYYHLSYSGAPLSYLWLYTTPPALVWEEMSKAYDHGARTAWIVNVGDIKPAEIGIEFFLQMAWDIHRWPRESLPAFLPQWATRTFSPGVGREVAEILDDYFRLNFDRKPEHLQWWLPKTAPRPSGWPVADIRARLDAFRALRARAERLRERVPPARQDAYFELVGYPVVAAALANERYFEAELGHLAVAQAAHAQLAALTARWHTELAGGKWRHVIAEEPADDQWRSFRISRWTPELAMASAAGERAAPTPPPLVTLEAEAYTARRAGVGAGWELIPGLGHSGPGAVALFPTTVPSYAESRLADDAPRLDYALTLPAAGTYRVDVTLLPTHALAGDALRLALGLDGGTPQLVVLPVKDGSADWAQGVLNARRVATATLTVTKPGRQLLNLYGVDAGVVVDSLTLTPQ